MPLHCCQWSSVVASHHTTLMCFPCPALRLAQVNPASFSTWYAAPAGSPTQALTSLVCCTSRVDLTGSHNPGCWPGQSLHPGPEPAGSIYNQTLHPGCWLQWGIRPELTTWVAVQRVDLRQPTQATDTGTTRNGSVPVGFHDNDR